MSHASEPTARRLRALSATVGSCLLPLFAAAMLLLQPGARVLMPRAPAVKPEIPEGAYAHVFGLRYVDLPDGYRVSVFSSPIDGGLLNEWRGGTPMVALGLRFFDGHADWLLVRDPAGSEGWVGEVFLSAEPPADAASSAQAGPFSGPPKSEAPPPVAEVENYVGDVVWDGPIRFCANPTGGPPGLDDDTFVGLVERAADRWQALADGGLPLASQGRCESAPDVHGDGVTTIGWAPDLGLMIAALTWPDVDEGVATEMDIEMSRGFFERLQRRDPTRTMRTCVFSTLVHEFGHVLGLEHPRDRTLRSSMQAVGASRCDKSQPTDADRTNLLRLYRPTDAP